MRGAESRISGRRAAPAFLAAGLLLLCGCHGDAANEAGTANGYDWSYGNPYYSASAWASGHRDSRNSDYVPVDGPSGLTLEWEFLDKLVGLTGVTGHGDEIYVATGQRGGDHLFALDAATGRVVWSSGEVGPLATTSSPIVDSEGNIFIADDSFMFSFAPDGRLYFPFGFPLADSSFMGLRDRGDHAELLFRNTDYLPLSCPVQTANNRTYLYCFERPLGKQALRIFDSLSGNLIEETAPFPQTFATLIYPDGRGFVYMTTNDFKGQGGIHAFAAAGR